MVDSVISKVSFSTVQMWNEKRSGSFPESTPAFLLMFHELKTKNIISNVEVLPLKPVKSAKLKLAGCC